MARITIDLPDKFRFETEIPIRIGDINYGGHLGNDAVLGMAHEARIRLLKHLGYSEVDVGGCGIILADAAIVYRSEAFHGQTVCVRVAVELTGRISCEFVYLMTDAQDRREIARVKTGIAFFDYTKRRLTRIPDAFREAISDGD